MIQEIKWRWAAIGVFAILQGCALHPENIRIDPTIELPKSLVAGANRIGVAASDARAMKKLGEVGDPNREMFDVSVNEDPSPAIYSRVSNALGKLGYKVAPYAEGMEPSLKIEVETLKLDSDKQAFDFVTQSMNTAGPAYSSDTTRLVNTAVSTALQDMLADQKLLDVLNK